MSRDCLFFFQRLILGAGGKFSIFSIFLTKEQTDWDDDGREDK